MRKQIQYLLVGSLLSLLPTHLFAGGGILQVLKGSAEILRRGHNTWESVPSRALVQKGDRIRTLINSLAFLKLEGEHQIAIGPETRLLIKNADQEKTEIFVEQGVIRNKVHKLDLQLGESYKVGSPQAVCSVRGTEFFTIAGSNQSAVKTLEGCVACGEKENEVLIQAGQHGWTLGPGTPMKVESFASNQKIDSFDWKKPETSIQKGIDPFSIISELQKELETSPAPQSISTTDSTQKVDAKKITDDTELLAKQTFSQKHSFETLPPDNSISQLTPTRGGGTVFIDALAELKQELDAHAPYNYYNDHLTNGLFEDGSVIKGPDGNLYQYASSIQKGLLTNASGDSFSSLTYTNATLRSGAPETLSRQEVTLQFNQPLTTTHWSQATQTALRGDLGKINDLPPAYYLTQVTNKRFNSVGEYTETIASNGSLVYLSADQRWQVLFKEVTGSIHTTTNHTKLFKYEYPTGIGTASYVIGGLVDAGSSANATDGYFNFYNYYAYPGITLRHSISIIDSDGNTIQPNTFSTGTSAKDFLVNQTYIFEKIESNLLSKPIYSMSSTRSRVMGGLLSIVNDTDAQNLIHGTKYNSIPDIVIVPQTFIIY